MTEIKESLNYNEGLKALKRMSSDNGYDYGPKEFEKDYELVENMLKANEILRIIFYAPSIINQLFELGELGKDATQRYFWGTISDADVKKVKEFFNEQRFRSIRKS